MDWSVALPNIWFLLITVLFTGFFVLEGYDFGVGVLAQLLGKMILKNVFISIQLDHSGMPTKFGY